MNEQQINDIRKDFPILSEKIYKKDLIYFDNGATTQKPRAVVEKIEEGYYHTNANIHRGVHFLSQKATEAHEAARETVAEFLGTDKKEEIIFTRGTTEAINLIAFSYGEAFCSEGDEIIVSVMEHHSNIVPWQMLCERKKMTLRVIPANEAGELDMDTYKNMLSERTKLVSVTHVSNVLGTINPVKEIIALAHDNNTPVLIDGAQAVPHIAVNAKEFDADFYVFSGHKIYAPTGIGVLYGKEKWLNAIPPYQGGGEMIATVTFEKTTYNELPFKFEAGTPAVGDVIGLKTAINYINSIGIENIAQCENELLQYATQQLQNIDGVTIIGTAEHKTSIISFIMKDIHHYDAGFIIDKMGVAVRTGHHCTQPIMDKLKISGTIRASFAFYNTREEIDQLVRAIFKTKEMLS